MSNDFRLLCIGDIHLGRRPTRVPDALAEHEVRRETLTPAAAWRATVDWALANQIDAVALAGDVVESLEDRFEAYGHLERGVRRLAEAGIAVVGVAGNHDVYALPRLAERIDGFRLLGAGGRWETVTLQAKDGNAKVRIRGWSFREEQVRDNPLDTLTPELLRGGDQGGAGAQDGGDAKLPTIGLLHCDLDQAGSAYAPVPRRSFENAPGNAWLLGHIHNPSDLTGARPIGYLGSLVGLDPGEQGLRGPWLARISADGAIHMQQQALAPLRWETIDVDVERLADPSHAQGGRSSDEGSLEPRGGQLTDALVALLEEAMRDIHRRIEPTLGGTRVVGCRLRLTGRSAVHRGIRHAVESGDLLAHVHAEGKVVYFIEKIIDRAAPAIHLQELAEAGDPPGLLARRILTLRKGGGPEYERLLGAARKSIEEAGQFATAALGDGAPATDDERTRELLLRAGMLALEELIAQQPGNGHAPGGESRGVALKGEGS